MFNVASYVVRDVCIVHMRFSGVAVHTHKFHESCVVASPYLPNHFLHVMM